MDVQRGSQARARISSSPLRAAVVLATLSAFGGCASTAPGANVQGAWTESAARPSQPYARVLVVAVSPDINSRCAFERVLASRLEGEATDAVASCDVIDRQAPLTRELVQKAVDTQKADAVLATRLVSKDWSAKGGGSRDTRGSSGYKATDAGLGYGYYGAYSVPVVYGEFQAHAESIVIVGQAEVESKLWSVAGPSVVYTLQTRVKGVESSDDGVTMVAGAIEKDLRKQGLVR